MRPLRVALSSLVVVTATIVLAPPAAACKSPTSPIVLDLNGDGIGTSNLLSSPVHFDLDGDGRAEQAGWTSQYDSDGFLWLDRNGNGVPDSGRELFGDATELSDGTMAANGFMAIAEYDSQPLGGNGDDEITAADAIYPFLRVWTDRNHNGQLDTGEDQSLSDLHIAVLSLKYDRSHMVDGCMNLHRFKSRYIMRNDKRSFSREMTDIFFQTR